MEVTLAAEAALDEEERRREDAVNLCVARRELRTQQRFFLAWRKFVRKKACFNSFFLEFLIYLMLTKSSRMPRRRF